MKRVAGLSLLVLLVGIAEVHAQLANPVMFEALYPTQALRGRTTIVSAAIPRGVAVEGAEITPAAGVRVSRMTSRGRSVRFTCTRIGW